MTSVCQPVKKDGRGMAPLATSGAPTQRAGRTLKIFARRRALIWRQSPRVPSMTTFWGGRSEETFLASGLEAQMLRLRMFGSGPTAVPGNSHFGGQENPTIPVHSA